MAWMPARKPPAPMESRLPHSIRFDPAEWAEICEEAQRRKLEPAVFVRQVTMYALQFVRTAGRWEDSLGNPLRNLRGLSKGGR